MPTTLTGSATKATTVSGPSAGEVGSSSAMRGSLQTLIDNDVYMQTLVETTGITVVRTAASSAALKALASVGNNGVVLLTSTGRLYRRNTAGTGSDVGTVYYDHDSESGGWDAVLPPNSVINRGTQTAGSVFSTTSSTYAAVTGASITLTGGKTGDIVRVTGNLFLNAYTDEVYVIARVTDGAAANNDLSTQETYSAGAVYSPLLAFHTLTADGSITVTLRAKNGNNATSVDTTVKAWQVEIIRP